MALLALQGCVQDSDQPEPITTYEGSSDLDLTNAVRQEDDMIQLGEHLSNPYTVANMQAAYDSLISRNPAYNVGLNIDPSHSYVRFLPETELQRNELLSDSIVEFFDYPLDYEIGETGTYYHDPTLPDSQPTWQYCVLPEDKQFPEVSYEILADLYLPELLAEEEREPLFLEIPNLLEDLVEEALRITGNLEDDNSAGKTAASSWNPSGRIRVYDDEVGSFIPLEGVKVRARRWFIIKTDRTDQNGDYQTGSFRRAANYSIKWEHRDYDIRRGHWAQAYHNGPKLNTDWDLDIAAGATASYHIAHIHRAAERYFFGNTGGLKRPNVWTRLKISYIAGQGSGINWAKTGNCFLPLLRSCSMEDLFPI